MPQRRIMDDDDFFVKKEIMPERNAVKAKDGREQTEGPHRKRVVKLQ